MNDFDDSYTRTDEAAVRRFLFGDDAVPPGQKPRSTALTETSVNLTGRIEKRREALMEQTNGAAPPAAAPTNAAPAFYEGLNSADKKKAFDSAIDAFEALGYQDIKNVYPIGKGHKKFMEHHTLSKPGHEPIKIRSNRESGPVQIDLETLQDTLKTAQEQASLQAATPAAKIAPAQASSLPADAEARKTRMKELLGLLTSGYGYKVYDESQKVKEGVTRTITMPDTGYEYSFHLREDKVPPAEALAELEEQYALASQRPKLVEPEQSAIPAAIVQKAEPVPSPVTLSLPEISIDKTASPLLPLSPAGDEAVSSAPIPFNNLMDSEQKKDIPMSTATTHELQNFPALPLLTLDDIAIPYANASRRKTNGLSATRRRHQ
jgi:hypothetical protein